MSAVSRLHSAPIVAGAYKPLTLDAESQEFLDTCKPSYIRSVAASVLRVFYSLTDTNAILNREWGAAQGLRHGRGGLSD